MKLWSVGVPIDVGDIEVMRHALRKAVMRMRAFGPGTLTGIGSTYNVVFAVDEVEDMNDMISRIKLRMRDEGVDDIPIYACELPRDTDWPGMGQVLNIDADALKAAAAACYTGNELPKAGYGKIPDEACERVCDTIELAARVEGIDEAIYRLKILEAQLHGVQSMAAKVGEAIDNLQLKLENRIATLAKPDR